MKKVEGNIHRYVFFLRLTSSLPEYFYHLSRALSDYDLMLVPISPKELLSYSRSNKAIVVNICDSLNIYRKFLIIRKSFLDFSLKNRNLTFIDFSSFAPISMSWQSVKNKNYYHIKLPMSIDKITFAVSYCYEKKMGDINIWPGGRRAKLPSGGSV